MYRVMYFSIFPLFVATSAYCQNIEFEEIITRKSSGQADAEVLFSLPSESTVSALRILKAQTASTNAMSGLEDGSTPGFKETVAWAMESKQPAVAVSDQMIIRVHPELGDGITDLISDYNLEVIDVYDGLGAFSAKVDLSQFYDDARTTDDRLEATISASNKFLEDERIIGATPNVTNFSGQNTAINNSEVVPRAANVASQSSEAMDWGISDIEANVLWSDPAASHGVLVGVIDVGFFPHEDLAFNGRLAAPVNDHGNHVAGIMCAKHNGIGVMGVLPECQIVAQAGNFLPVPSEGDGVESFMLLFSQILLSMNEFVNNRDEVAVFNASLGYNWQRNFSLNPSASDKSLVRASIQNQAVFLFPALSAARDRNTLIFSAAGNDSSETDNREALWASPFNWAAKTACNISQICSGIVVEAHDSQGNRAPFSNIGGDISCPGVNVNSTVARNDQGAPVNNFYGEMDGTSMASPYCASGFVLFSLLRPTYTATEAMECIKLSAVPSAQGAPRMKLSAALARCP